MSSKSKSLIDVFLGRVQALGVVDPDLKTQRGRQVVIGRLKGKLFSHGLEHRMLLPTTLDLEVKIIHRRLVARGLV